GGLEYCAPDGEFTTVLEQSAAFVSSAIWRSFDPAVSGKLSCPMPPSAVILFAHGAREPEWAHPFEEVRDRLRDEGLRVELAYLEAMKPDLNEAANALAAE